MFSVIIPVFNKARYIKKCIESVLLQTYVDFELLIIDDGSTDESLALIRRFSDSRIKLLLQQNTGVSVARNNAVLAAKYENIAFLDADDWWHPEYLNEAFMLISNYPEASLYGINYYYVKNSRSTVEAKGLPTGFTTGYIDYFLAYGTTFCAPINCSFIIVPKSTFLKEGGFRSNLRMGEDVDLWIRLALTGKVAYSARPLAYSNQDVDSSNRAIGGHILYPPSNHFVFNLAYLRPYEMKSASLKKLLDGLRVRALLPYYSIGEYEPEVRAILASVNFSNQPTFFRIVYATPIRLAHLYMQVMYFGSRLKRVIRERTQI